MKRITLTLLLVAGLAGASFAQANNGNVRDTMTNETVNATTNAAY